MQFNGRVLFNSQDSKKKKSQVQFKGLDVPRTDLTVVGGTQTNRCMAAVGNQVKVGEPESQKQEQEEK